jgi:endonuclease/exonuclease/phosphatase family metal-dependent hydrolase
MTWNVRGRSDPPVDAIAARIADLAPDVVGLQEVQKRQARRIAARAGFPHQSWAFKHRPAWRWWRAEGLAILSRHPIVDRGTQEVSAGESRASWRRRVVQRTAVVLPDTGELPVANTHLTTGSGQSRRDQANRLAQAIPNDGASVLVGDLNVDDEPDVFGPLERAGYRRAGPLAGDTFPAGAVDRRLDHVLVRGAVDLGRAWIPADGPEWAALSDHLPVVVDLEVGG